MRLLKKLLLTSTGVALSGFLVSACAKNPLTAPSTPSVTPPAGLMGTVNMKSNDAIISKPLAQKNAGANREVRVKKKRSGYMVSSS
jgi:hypothetical protein